MKPKMLRELTLEQLMEIQGERFAENLQSGRDVDVYSNHVNRHVVRALAEEKDAAFLGVLSPPYEEMPLFRPWEGERIPAFTADFCVPTLDEELIRLVEDYREHRGECDPETNAHRLMAIHDRLREVGGISLPWFAGDRESEGDSNDLEYDLGEAW